MRRWHFILTGLLMSSLGAATMNAESSITLSVKVSDREFKSGAPQDITFTLVFRNQGKTGMDLYPQVAQWSGTPGWVSPVWSLTVRPLPALESATGRADQPSAPLPLHILRTYYGPPGMPPTAPYFQTRRLELEAGKEFTHTMTSCWLPYAQLKKEHLALTTLDPKHMDGLSEAELTHASVLVLERSCSDLLREMKQRTDFLRPGTMVFFPSPGAFDLELSYVQEAWGSFKPAQKARLAAPPVRIEVQIEVRK